MKENDSVLKTIAELITMHLGSLVEIIASIVIAIALVRFAIRYITQFGKPRIELENQKMRIQFGSSLTLSLELLLAADILATAIAPTWDEIGKLAAIATLRTALNYFLERELSSTESTQEVQSTSG